MFPLILSIYIIYKYIAFGTITPLMLRKCQIYSCKHIGTQNPDIYLHSVQFLKRRKYDGKFSFYCNSVVHKFKYRS